MVLDGLAWNTSPGACEEDPPAAGSDPWSTTVTSVHPRSDSSSARAAPTTPAPMITTRGAGRRVLRTVPHPPVVVVGAVDERAVEAGAEPFHRVGGAEEVPAVAHLVVGAERQ